MLFHTIRSGCEATVRAGKKVPAGLDCGGREPRAKFAIAPRSSDRVRPKLIWSAKVTVDVRMIERLAAGVLNSTAKAGAPAAVMRFMSEGEVKRFVGDARSKSAPITS